MKRYARLLGLFFAPLIASIALAADVGPGSPSTVGSPVMGKDGSSKNQFVQIDAAGNLRVTLAAGATVSHLSASGGDALTTAAPTNGSAQGYALSPSYSALRVAFSDASQARIVTKWVQDSLSKNWHAGNQLTSTAVTGAAGDVTFDQLVLVGDGRIYFQIVDSTGSPLSVDVIAETK